LAVPRADAADLVLTRQTTEGETHDPEAESASVHPAMRKQHSTRNQCAGPAK
jgi:hypothetical protein